MKQRALVRSEGVEDVLNDGVEGVEEVVGDLHQLADEDGERGVLDLEFHEGGYGVIEEEKDYRTNRRGHASTTAGSGRQRAVHSSGIGESGGEGRNQQERRLCRCAV